MTAVDDLLRWMRRFEVPNPDACRLCGGSSGHVAIDGLACYPCILREGRLAGDPLHMPIGIVADTWEAHEDVVALRTCQRHGQCWSWIGWTPEHELVDPAAAEAFVGQAYRVALEAGL